MNTKQAKKQLWYTPEQEKEIYGELLRDGFFGDVRSNIIYHNKNYDNVKLKFTCKTKSPAIAYRYAPTEVKRRLKLDQKKGTVRLLISELLAKYIESRKSEVQTGELKEVTHKIIIRSLRPVVEYFGEEFPEIFEQKEDPSKDQKDFKHLWREFVEHYKETNERVGDIPCIENIAKYVNAALKWAHESGFIKTRVRVADPYRAQARKARKKKKNFVFSRRDYVMMRRRACRRDRLIIMLGGELAYRITDCVSLKWSHLILDGEDPVIKIEGDDKAHYFVDIPLSKRLVRALSYYKRDYSNSGSDYIFWQVTNPKQHIKPQQAEITQAMRKAGVKRGTHHHLRHCRLTEDFSNPLLPQAEVLAIRRVSYEVFLEHYFKQTAEARKRIREGSRGFV